MRRTVSGAELSAQAALFAALCIATCLSATNADADSTRARTELAPLVTTDAETQTDLLGAWIDAQAAQQKRERRFTGGSVLAIGAAGLGFGTALLVGSPNNELSKGGGVALMAAGAFGVGLGIFRLVVESDAEELAKEFALARSHGIDDQTRARFEGAFYAASRHAVRVQRLARWLGLATAVAGVGVLVATPLADLSRGGRVAGYVAGGLLVLGGGVNLASSFGTPPPLQAWERYRQGIGPSPSSGRLFGLAPSLHPRLLGVTFRIETGRPRL